MDNVTATSSGGNLAPSSSDLSGAGTDGGLGVHIFIFS
jgi:hypothetical protein